MKLNIGNEHLLCGHRGEKKGKAKGIKEIRIGGKKLLIVRF